MARVLAGRHQRWLVVVEGDSLVEARLGRVRDQGRRPLVQADRRRVVAEIEVVEGLVGGVAFGRDQGARDLAALSVLWAADEVVVIVIMIVVVIVIVVAEVVGVGHRGLDLLGQLTGQRGVFVGRDRESGRVVGPQLGVGTSAPVVDRLGLRPGWATIARELGEPGLNGRVEQRGDRGHQRIEGPREQLADRLAAVERRQQVALLGHDLEIELTLVDDRVAIEVGLERFAGSRLAAGLEQRDQDQALGRRAKAQAVVVALGLGLVLILAVVPGEDVVELVAKLSLEPVAEVALRQDAHLDQQLALLLAGPADRLERLIALGLGDQPLAREDLPEALGEHVRADGDWLATFEEDDLLGVAIEEEETARTARPGDLADELGEGAAAQRSLEGEPEARFNGLRHGASAGGR